MFFPSTFDVRNFRGAALAAALLLTPATAHADGAFAGFAGNWSGNGTITIAEGGTERIRCRGTYSVDGGGNTLHQVLRCASDSYKFELISDIAAKGGNITGSWSEASRGVNGTVEGSVADGQVSALVQANGYAATFNVSTRGNRQSVNISSKGELRGVTINLLKGG